MNDKLKEKTVEELKKMNVICICPITMRPCFECRSNDDWLRDIYRKYGATDDYDNILDNYLITCGMSIDGICVFERIGESMERLSECVISPFTDAHSSKFHTTK